MILQAELLPRVDQVGFAKVSTNFDFVPLKPGLVVEAHLLKHRGIPAQR